MTHQAAPELLPCPFCGEQPELTSWDNGFCTGPKVRCNTCKISFSATSDDLPIIAIKKWNTRAAQPQELNPPHRCVRCGRTSRVVRLGDGCPFCDAQPPSPDIAELKAEDYRQVLDEWCADCLHFYDGGNYFEIPDRHMNTIRSALTWCATIQRGKQGGEVA